MSGVRKTIYVPDDFDWDGLQAKAKDMGMSISQLLLSDSDQLARMEAKIDKMISVKLELPVKDKCWYCEKVHDLRIACPEYVGRNEVTKAEYPETVEDKVIGTVRNFIKERDYQFHVKPPKGSVKANAAMNSFFKPQPKLKDKAKK